jgi:hypothetical protein
MIDVESHCQDWGMCTWNVSSNNSSPIPHRNRTILLQQRIYDRMLFGGHRIRLPMPEREKQTQSSSLSSDKRSNKIWPCNLHTCPIDDRESLKWVSISSPVYPFAGERSDFDSRNSRSAIKTGDLSEFWSSSDRSGIYLKLALLKKGSSRKTRLTVIWRMLRMQTIDFCERYWSSPNIARIASTYSVARGRWDLYCLPRHSASVFGWPWAQWLLFNKLNRSCQRFHDWESSLIGENRWWHVFRAI